MNWRKWTKPTLAVIALLAVGVVASLTYDSWDQYLTQARDVFSSPGSIRGFVSGFGVWAPVVFVLIQVAQVLLSPIPAGATTLAGAFAFGIWPGLALGMIGSVAGSVIVFCAVRRWGEPLVVRIVGRDLYSRYAGKLGRNGWWLFVIFLLPFLPDDAVCAVAGISAVSFRRFLVMMSVGRLPGTTATVMLASDTVTGSPAVWISVGVVLVALVVLGLIYRERLEARIVGRMKDESDESEVEESKSCERKLEKVG